MSQTKKGSFIESWANVVIGFTINFVANLVILPAFGFSTLTAKTNFIIGLIYTVISVVRSYFMRRLFNKIKSRWNYDAQPEGLGTASRT